MPIPPRRSPPRANTPITRPTPLTIPNGIRIELIVLPHYTFRTDRYTSRQMTDGIGNRSTPLVRMLAILIDSDALTIAFQPNSTSAYRFLTLCSGGLSKGDSWILTVGCHSSRTIQFLLSYTCPATNRVSYTWLKWNSIIIIVSCADCHQSNCRKQAVIYPVHMHYPRRYSIG